MKLLTNSIAQQLLRNGQIRLALDETGEADADLIPVVNLRLGIGDLFLRVVRRFFGVLRSLVGCRQPVLIAVEGRTAAKGDVAGLLEPRQRLARPLGRPIRRIGGRPRRGQLRLDVPSLVSVHKQQAVDFI